MSNGARAYWDQHSTAWDDIYLDESWLARKANQTLRKAIYERFAVALSAPGDLSGKTLLDVGCGSGRLALEALKRGAERVVGVDFAPSMLEIARRQAEADGIADSATFIDGDFLQAPLDVTFDIVVANGFFDYVADPEPVLKRMVALSRGWVIASFPGKSPLRNLLRKVRYGMQGCDVYFYDAGQIEKVARAAGLTNFELRFMPHSGTGFMLIGQV